MQLGLGLGFAALALRRVNKKTDGRSKTGAFDSGVAVVNGYLLQAVLGLAVTIVCFYLLGSFAASGDPYSYYLGDDLFVCPVIRLGARSRTVRLPEGEWVGLWTGRCYAPGRHRVAAPLGRPPVFYREGSKYAELFRRAADGV